MIHTKKSEYFPGVYKGYPYYVGRIYYDEEIVKKLKDLSPTFVTSWWTGYIPLFTISPYYKVSYSEIPWHVHGGLTFGGKIDEIPYEFLVGFDMNHAMDQGGSKKRAIKWCKELIRQALC